MDGLEYKRTKFNKWVRKFIFWEERTAVRYSHYLISDNMGIHDYYKEKYGKESKYLAYGANIYDNYQTSYLCEFGLKRHAYYLLVARLEPENNIEMAIQGYLDSKGPLHDLIIVGKTNTPHGKYLVDKYGAFKGIRFIGGIYDFDKLNSLRHFSLSYFHGHSVGGTNPSLLEAMASDCFIFAHDNIFNRSVLGEHAFYYSDSSQVTSFFDGMDHLVEQYKSAYTAYNLSLIRDTYSWDRLVDEHEAYFYWLLEQLATVYYKRIHEKRATFIFILRTVHDYRCSISLWDNRIAAYAHRKYATR